MSSYQRPHIKIPGTGDEYLWNGSSLTVSGGALPVCPSDLPKTTAPPKRVPIAQAAIVPSRERPPQKYPGMGPPDPVLERERAVIGAVILGWSTALEVDDHVRQFSHRQIIDALAQVDLGSGDRLAGAITWCRSVGLAPELCGTATTGSSHAGYLAGCVRAARLLGEDAFTLPPEPAPTIEAVAPAAPAAPASEEDAPTDAEMHELAIAEMAEDDADEWDRGAS